MENKFKKGDWVRAVRSCTGISKGDVVRVANTARPTSCGPYEEREFEPWQPKVGERVRFVRDSTAGGGMYGAKGDAATVVGEHRTAGHFRAYVDVKIDDSSLDFDPSAYVDDLEPLPVAAEAQPAAPERVNAGGGFKAGDKIELVDGAIDGVRAIGDVYEAVAHKSPTHKNSVRYIDKNGTETWAPGSFFKLHAALTIQAGKFYKTRDGRKVGPMISYRTGKWEWVIAHGDGNIWLSDGTHKPACAGGGSYMSESGDLIAEWVDAPVPQPVRTTNIAATVDAINDEYGPVVSVAEQPARFKVGDRVRLVDSHPYILGEHQTTGTIVRRSKAHQYGEWGVSIDNYGGPLTFLESELSLLQPAIVCKIDNSRPLPATRPRLHDSIESADAEAKRLASLHKGQEFGVFAMTGTPHKVEKTYEHEWQRLAADGRKDAAYSAFAKSAGIRLPMARRVVLEWLKEAA